MDILPNREKCSNFAPKIKGPEVLCGPFLV